MARRSRGTGQSNRRVFTATNLSGPPRLGSAYHRPMADIPVGEPLETKLSEPEGSLTALESAAGADAVAKVAARYPTCLAAWAQLGEEALAEGRSVDAYAYFRVGYHRGLDRMRSAGWRGRGKLPWGHLGNQGFLRSLRGLGRAAEAIGETEEAERCAAFFSELVPDSP